MPGSYWVPGTLISPFLSSVSVPFLLGNNIFSLRRRKIPNPGKGNGSNLSSNLWVKSDQKKRRKGGEIARPSSIVVREDGNEGEGVVAHDLESSGLGQFFPQQQRRRPSLRGTRKGKEDKEGGREGRG